jgi:hypothetical protein
MYNMDISINGYKINIEIIILIGVICLILFSYTLCGCCNGSIIETMTNLTVDSSGNDNKDSSGNDNKDSSGNDNKDSSGSNDNKDSSGNNNKDSSGNNNKDSSGNDNKDSPDKLTIIKQNLSNILNTVTKEGFASALYADKPYNLTTDQPMSVPVKQSSHKGTQSAPLSESTTLIFSNTQFKPECCPNTYSTSSGCACMTDKALKLIQTRGANNSTF